MIERARIAMTCTPCAREGLVKALAVQANAFPGYETDTIEDTAAPMVTQVAESTADVLRHTPECKVRKGGRYYWDCDCGVRDD